MKDITFEAHLVAANPYSDHTNSFVKDTMKKVTAQSLAGKLPRQTLWQRFARTHKIAFAAIAIAIISIVSFSGYAYAIGSDPISLIKRWVEGNKVKVEYNGRQFEYGKTRNYSDAAITAYAELNTVQSVAFAADSAMNIPKDGAEYLTPPANMLNYGDPVASQPKLGTITAVTDTAVTFHMQYSLGDKMNPSQTQDKTVSIPRAGLQYFVKGARATVNDQSVGKLIQVRFSTFLKHIQDSSAKPIITTVYYGFELNHSLAEFKEADKAAADGTGKNNDERLGLFEPNIGALSDRCLNNGAEVCDPAYYRQDGQSLYGREQHGDKSYNKSNPQALAFGEGASQGQQPSDMISRGVQGTITAMSPTAITIKGSSGAEWHLAFNEQDRHAFKNAWNTELKMGDKIGAMVIQSIYDLDSRTIDVQHIITMLRY